MKAVLAVLLILTATVARADLESHSSGFAVSTGPVWQPLEEIVVTWAQVPDPEAEALASQFAADYPFDARSADDFFCEENAPITAVEWWGNYWNPGAPPYADYFVIRFYSDVEASPHHLPGELLYEEDCLVYSEETEGEVYHYTHELEVAFPQEIGNVYWFSVQAVHGFFSGSQWGWCECVEDDYWESEATMVFPELGIPDWTAMTMATGAYHEMAFVLYGNVANPAHASSWSRIKAIFR